VRKSVAKAAPLRTWLITLFLLAVVAACLALYTLAAPQGIDSLLGLLAR